MKRREFLVAGAGGVAAALAVRVPAAESATPSAAQVHKIGDFELLRTKTGIAVRHQTQPERLLWEADERTFLTVEQATAAIKAFGKPEGAYDIRDKVEATFNRATIQAVSVDGAIATVTGELSSKKGKLGYQITFEALSTAHLRFDIAATGAGAEAINRIRLRSASVADEGFFGFGQQLTVFNQKGALIPILVQEHGVAQRRSAPSNRRGGA